MILRWETEKEQLLAAMRIPAKQKLEWLREMNEFSQKYTPRKQKAIRGKLKEAQSKD